MAKNTFLEFSTTAADNTDIAGIGIQGTNAVSNFDNAFRTQMAILRRDLDGRGVYLAKSGPYTAVANDNNAVIRFTASATLSLTAAATLGNGWHVDVVAAAGTVTIDPNASETINGSATLVIPTGQTTRVWCDGTNFFADTGSWARNLVYSLKTSGYTAVYADINTVFRFTSSATLALSPVASLGINWSCSIVADGGDVTIDPDGSELINGRSTLIVPNGSSAQIVCTGTTFYTVIKPVVWEPIQNGLFTGTAASSFVLLNLGSYPRIRLTGTISTSTDASLNLQTSTNNGGAWASGASDYSSQNMSVTGAVFTGAVSTSSALVFSAITNLTGHTFTMTINRFNVAAPAEVLSDGGSLNSTNIFKSGFYGRRNDSTARNALRIYPGVGTMTYNILAEGCLI